MTLPLATDPIEIAHGRHAVRLNPSLRAAYRLNRRYGMGRLGFGVLEGNLSIIFDVIAEGAEDRQAARQIVERKLQSHFGEALESLKSPTLVFIRASFGIDPDPATDHPAEQRAKSGKPFDMERTLTEFFEIATGWLGWSPEAAWSAIPAEILAAQRGLVAKLTAIHGSGDHSADSAPATYDPIEDVPIEQVRAGLSELRAKMGGAR